MIKQIANIVTGSRIIGSVLLVFFPVFSVEFYIVYIICGFSDMIDGAIARKTNSTSQFGDKFDTVADFVFVTISLIKFFSALHVPEWLWVWGVAIGIIKIGSIIRGYVSKKQFVSLHTKMNKATGLLLFVLPLTLYLVELKYSSLVACSIATFAAIQEWVYIVGKK